MKQMIKFKFQDKEGFFSVVEKSNHYYTLVKKDTPKVFEVQKTKKLWISYDIKQPKFQEVLVNVLCDQTSVQWVYDELKRDENLYFKELDDSLCVFEIPKA